MGDRWLVTRLIRLNPKLTNTIACRYEIARSHDPNSSFPPSTLGPLPTFRKAALSSSSSRTNLPLLTSTGLISVMESPAYKSIPGTRIGAKKWKTEAEDCC